MVLSGIIKNKGKKIVRVSFLRGDDWAEGTAPDGIIEKSEGFTKEELEDLKVYIIKNQADIFEQAKKINPIRSWIES